MSSVLPTHDLEGSAAPSPSLEGASERELRALVRVAAAAAGALRFEEVLEVAAEEACAVLACSTVSVSRWNRRSGELETLINVGELAPDEERWPTAERYPLADFLRANALLERGQPHTTHLDDPDADPAEAALLRTLGKHASLAVPVVHDKRTWGELYITRGGRETFVRSEISFVAAVAAQVGVAVVRAESYARIARLAFEDPLTGLANRRSFDDHLATTVEAATTHRTDLALVLCDLDGLKTVNDTLGHPAGDQRLLAAARALRAVAAGRADALAARIGGDEFALVLTDAGAPEAEQAARELAVALAAEDASATVSSGVAALSLGSRRPGELVRLADEAQYHAKRMGGGRVSVAISGLPRDQADRRRRGRGERGAQSREWLLCETVRVLDTELAHAPAIGRLEAVLAMWAVCAGADAWAVARLRPDGVLETVVTGTGEAGGSRFSVTGDAYVLVDYPATVRLMATGGSLLVHADDHVADPHERAFLVSLGHGQMLSLAVPGSEPLLGELFANAEDGALAAAQPYLRTLAVLAGSGARAAGPTR